MIAAGEDVLASHGERLPADELVVEIYRAIAAKAPLATLDLRKVIP